MSSPGEGWCWLVGIDTKSRYGGGGELPLYTADENWPPLGSGRGWLLRRDENRASKDQAPRKPLVMNPIHNPAKGPVLFSLLLQLPCSRALSQAGLQAFTAGTAGAWRVCLDHMPTGSLKLQQERCLVYTFR